MLIINLKNRVLTTLFSCVRITFHKRGIYMPKINNIDRMVYLKMLSHYLKIYQDKYPELAVEFIKEHFLERMPISDTTDVLKQIYALFGILDESENCYLGFSNMVGERYGWDSNILEIGGGFFPMFSKYVDESQRESGSKGTITTYDPDLIVDSLGNIKLHKENFTEEMSIESYDLLVGIMPCEATRMIIRKATQEHKEFFLAMCGCVHSRSSFIPSALIGYDNYVDEIYNLAKLQEKDGFEVTKETGWQYSFRYPIISSRRKK